LCEKCITFLGQAIVNAGYTREELNALPLDTCATENLSTLLANGATIDSFLKVSACPRDASVFENVTFPEEEGDIGRAVQSAFAPVVEKGDAVDATEKKKKTGVDIVGLSVSMAVIVVCFAGIILFALHRDKKRQKLNALYVQRNHDAERNVPVAARPVREILSFRNITCQLKTNGGGGGGGGGVKKSAARRTIISGISGIVCEGSVCAVMGPSGCGKTTLVKSLISASVFHVDIDLNKVNLSGNAHFTGKNRIGYVPQHSDYLLKFLTTSESILYAASLRLPWYVSKQTKENKVNALLDELCLVVVRVVLRWTSVVLTSISYYWLMGLRVDPGAFFIFLSFALLFSATSTALMSFIQTLCASTAIATLVGIVCILLSSLFGGFLINIPTLPGFCRWIRWFSAFFYAWGGMLASEMNDGKYVFDADFDGTDVAVTVSGSTYLNVVGVDPANIGRDMVALCIVIGVYMASAIFMYRRFQ